MFLLVFILSFIVILVLFTLYCRYCRFGRLLAKIPGVEGLPLIGNAVQTFSLDPPKLFVFIRRVNKKYGPINKLSSFLIGIVNISHPDYVEKLYSTSRFNKKSKHYNFFKSWLGEGLLISDGEKWRYRRKLLTPAFHFTILRDFCKTFDDHTERLLEQIQKETKIDRTDVVSLITQTTLRIMCETSMETSVEDDADDIFKKYFTALKSFGWIVDERVIKPYLYVDFIFNLLPISRVEKKVTEDLHRLTQNIIDKKKADWKNNRRSNDMNKSKSKKRLAMLDLLFEEEEKGNIDMEGIREETDTFLFGGHDTVGMATSFMIMRIANEPEVQEKIFQEMVEIFGDTKRKPTMDDLQEMKYLDCCIKESLRIYPSIHCMAREISEEVTLGGYVVPKGTMAMIHVYDIHHDPAIYPDPERFIPERFLPEAVAARHTYAYIPFSAGPRNCIGQKFAMAEMKTVMSGLIRRFRLEPVTKPHDIVFLADIVLRPHDPMYVRFEERERIV